MLYVTTRTGDDTFTAFRALSDSRSPDGGFFVPLRMPSFDAEQIASFAERSFVHNVAEVLNLFFGTQINGSEMELGIGRYPVKLIGLNGKTTVAKTWHNPVLRFDRLVCGVEKAIRQSDRIGSSPSNWLLTASRVAALFGVYGQLMQTGVIKTGQKVDISVPSGDLSRLMAAWYARKMGLPLGMIVCCCNENNALWNLFHKGELRTDAVANCTYTPDCDFAVPPDLERLLFAVFGHDAVERYQEVCMTGGTYDLDEEQIERLREGIHISVVSEKRMGSVIPNLYKTTGFLADPYTALAYSGLTDYRCISTVSGQALIISEESPLFSLEFVAQCMGMLPGELKKRFD